MIVAKVSILPRPNPHFLFIFFQAVEPCPRPVFLILVLRRPKGLQFVSLKGGRKFRGANKNGGTDRMRVGRARERRYAYEAEATTLEFALVFSYARELSCVSLIMHALYDSKRYGKAGNNIKCSTRFNLSCNIAAKRVQSSVTTRFTPYESSNLSCNKSCCGRL